MINWNDIDDVFLDMDGTLLDLHFDNYFWMEYLPNIYANKNNQSLEQVRPILLDMMKQAEGTLNWYCLDYWTKTLDLDIVSMKREVDHLIEVRPMASEFLEALHSSNKNTYLITNAHHDALELKLEKSQISHYFDDLVSSHQFGHAKEAQEFWHCLQDELSYDPKRTLFVDDSKAVLDSAQQYGIKHLLFVSRPDMKRPARTVSDYPILNDFSDIMNGLNGAAQS